jgi:hypothetical protein
MVDFKQVFLAVLAVAFVFGSFAVGYAGGLPWYGTGFVVALVWLCYVLIARAVYVLSGE